ncbi:hypothetical protein B6U91_02115 [Candidatus Pacearchaeota archaeon ex4484_71]|nr:MAG: hypothetical protein B6U91_02115 [Candidatus Pacearchaeota archaeon ex4484_71]
MGNIKEAIKDFRGKEIIVMGDVLLDKFTFGEINRLNPDHFAAPLVNVQREEYVLGGAANVANNVNSLGGTAYLFGLVGEDEAGEIMKDECANRGIIHFLLKDENPTIVKQRVIAHNKQVVRLDFGENSLEKMSEENEKSFLNILEKGIKGKDALVLSDYNKIFFRGSKNLAKEIISLGVKYGVPILSDIKPPNAGNFFGSNIISPNLKEAEEITGIKYTNEKSLEDMARYLNNSLGAEKIVITRGDKGVFGYDFQKRDYFLMKTNAKEVADQTGAGDTFIATMSLGVSSGLDLRDSLRLANYASGIVVGKVGTATVHPSELEKILKKRG